MTTEVEEINGNVLETVKPVETKTEVPEPAKEKAYSIVFDKQMNKWVAVELLFNYTQGTLGGIKVVEQNVNKNIINERFHVLIGQNLL